VYNFIKKEMILPDSKEYFDYQRRGCIKINWWTLHNNKSYHKFER